MSISLESKVQTWGFPQRSFSTVQFLAFPKWIQHLMYSCFGGQPGHLIPLYGVDAIASGCFEMAGKLIIHSILHGGPGFSGLAPAIVQYLCTGSLDKSKHLVTIEDLYDLELKEILEEHVSNSNSHHFRGSFLLCSKLLLVNNLFDGFMIFTCTYIISKTNKGNFYIKGCARGLTLKWCKKNRN